MNFLTESGVPSGPVSAQPLPFIPATRQFIFRIFHAFDRRSGAVVIAINLLLLAGFAPGAYGAGSGYGFAWANNSKQARYTPSETYAFNSSGGSISIQRRGTGTYQVNFAGLGGHGTAGGNVQVTAYGNGSEQCKVVSWNSGGADFIIDVKCIDIQGGPADTQFSIHALWPGQSTLDSSGSSKEIYREILADGKVKIKLSDGSTRINFSGGYTITTPDGQSRTVLFSTQAPSAIPPSPPDGSQEQVWLEHHSQGLLNTISRMVNFDQQSIDNYLAAEGDVGIYDKLAKRRQTLDFMVSE
jgi:hypothetical protein